MVSAAALPPELRAPVVARSLPDGALNGMRRALAALGGGGGEEDSEMDAGANEVETGKGSQSQPASTSSWSTDAGVVDALAAVELRREVQLWDRICYKSTSQHRRSMHFQRMRGVTRHLRAFTALNVGAAAATLRDALSNGVSENARALALSSPAVAAGAHALWKLPPRALWEDLARRLRAAARVAADADDAMLAAAAALTAQLAHTYFMPFALTATAAVARLRAGLHQLVVDVVVAGAYTRPLFSST
jgi:hypothetical protein